MKLGPWFEQKHDSKVAVSDTELSVTGLLWFSRTTSANDHEAKLSGLRLVSQPRQTDKLLWKFVDATESLVWCQKPKKINKNMKLCRCPDVVPLEGRGRSYSRRRSVILWSGWEAACRGRLGPLVISQLVESQVLFSSLSGQSHAGDYRISKSTWRTSGLRCYRRTSQSYKEIWAKVFFSVQTELKKKKTT